LIIVDLPSTGHAVPLLSVSRNIFRLFKKGPLFRRAQQLQAFLSDRRNVALVWVALPGDMPVTETIEAHFKLGDQVPLSTASVFVNRLPSVRFSLADTRHFEHLFNTLGPDAPPRVKAALKTAMEAGETWKRIDFQLKRLANTFAGPLLGIDEVVEILSKPVAYRVAEAMEREL
jgi:anion-transporting  ArsA/GET3 family ATPase